MHQALTDYHYERLAKKQYYKLMLIRFVSTNIFIFLVQLIGIVLSYPLPIQVFFPATGTAFAFVYLRGVTILPGILLASLSVIFFATHDIAKAMLASLQMAMLSAGLLWLIYQFSNPFLIFNRLKHFLQFLLCCIFICVLSKGFHVLNSIAWLLHLNAILMLSLAIITFDAYFPDMQMLKQQKRIWYAYLLSIALVAVCQVIFTNPLISFLFAFLNLILIGYMSLAKKWCGAVLASSTQGFVLQFAALLSAPVFQTPTAVIGITSLSINLIVALSLASIMNV